jgi:REP-associated tyrosine transposase
VAGQKRDKLYLRNGPQGRGYSGYSFVKSAVRFPMKRTFGRRPPRLARIFATGPLYFVTFCTHERRRFLATDQAHAAFVFFAKCAQCNFNVAVGRYVIMPDHVHLFVRGEHNFRLGPWIGALKQALAKAATFSRAEGQIWEEGFFDHILRSNESYSQKWIYVRENPVRAGLVKSAAEWPYQGEIVYIDRA